ncbi:MAG: cupredoxin domain-containing protein [Patescibacteria group bacterium]
MNKLIGIIALLIIVLGGMWFLTKDTNTVPVTTEEDVTKIIAEPTSTIREFTVVGTDFKFLPAEIKVNVGDTVKITLKNPDVMPHDFKIDEFNAATKIITKGGADDTIEFVADKIGTFEYYCSVGSHRAKGMVGKLIVE